MRIVALVYLGLAGCVYFFQTWMIYPGHSTQGQPDSHVTPALGTELVHLKTRDGVPIVAIFAPAENEDGSARADAAQRPTLVWFYGNAMCLVDCDDMIRGFRREGLNVICPEYVGYGMSGGKPSEEGCYQTGEAAYDYLLTRSDIDPHRIISGGWSLGGGAAFGLAVRRPVIAVATFSTFSSMTAMGRKVFPWLPTSIFLRDKFDNVAKARQLSCPIFIAHGERDPMIPPSMAGDIASAAKGPVTRVVVPGAEHVGLFDVGGKELRDEFGAFCESVMTSEPVAK